MKKAEVMSMIKQIKVFYIDLNNTQTMSTNPFFHMKLQLKPSWRMVECFMYYLSYSYSILR